MQRHLTPILMLVPAITSFALTASADLPRSVETTQAFFKQHCITCHGADDPEGDLSLVELSEVTRDNAAIWQRVLRQLATGEMPPDG
jgi:mono/diheme cytochrome c family protein